MLDVVLDMPNQIIGAFDYGKELSFKGFNKIIAVGMGGSGISGNVLKAMIDFPVSVYNDYKVYEPIDSKTLLFVISYSGNTEETLEIYKDALRKKCKICAITSGGKLLRMSSKNKNACVVIPEGFEPRAAIVYLVFPMLRIMQNSGIIRKVDIKSLSTLMKRDSFVNDAKEIASNIGSKMPIVYASERFKVVAYRWKCQFNENTKLWAIYNVFSEANHNEILPLTRNKNVYVIMVKDKDDHKRIKRRMDVIKRIAEKSRVKSIIIEPKGKNIIEKVFSTIYLGDLVSCYLAKNHNIDADEMKLLEDFKKML